MLAYRPPQQDIGFALAHFAGSERFAGWESTKHADPETIADLLAELGRFASEVWAPLNQVGDVEGVRLDHDTGRIVMPRGFPEAYHRYVAAGWNAVPFPADFGGGDFPWAVAVAMQELLFSANMAFTVCTLLTQGAIDALLHHGSEEQQERYLPRMVSGQWTGTMNMTEPEAGSDVGALRCRAVPADDGTWRIFGQKVLEASASTMTDDIVHLVPPDPRCAPGHQGDQLLRRAQVRPRCQRCARCAQRHRLRLHRAQDGPARQPDLRAVLWRRRWRQRWPSCSAPSSTAWPRCSR